MEWFTSHIDWTIVVSIIVALSIYYEVLPTATFGVCKLVRFPKRRIGR